MNEEILDRVVAGDEEACNELLETYKLMIYSIISSYELNYGDYVISEDDLFQEGCIGLFEACKSYKRDSETKFSTYAYVVIERRIQRSFFRLLRPYKKEFSFDKFVLTNHIENNNYRILQEKGINYHKDNKDNDEILNNIVYASKEDKEIIKLRLQNYTYKEIAEKLKISPKRVDNRITRIKKINKKGK